MLGASATGPATARVQAPEQAANVGETAIAVRAKPRRRFGRRRDARSLGAVPAVPLGYDLSVDDSPFPDAPDGPVASAGGIRYGRYLGNAGTVDWSRAPRNALWRFLHKKRWQYAAILAEELVAAVAIVDLGWSATGFAYVFDRRKRQVVADVSPLGLPGRFGAVADHTRPGARSTFHSGDVRLAIAASDERWRVEAHARRLRIEVDLVVGPNAATLCAIAPVPRGLANCTHKSHLLAARGSIAAGDTEWVIDGATALGSLDHTSGLLARDTSWRWASAAAGAVAVNLVEGFQEPLENALWRDGVIEPLPPVEFVRQSDPEQPWRIRSRDGAVDLEFRPEGVRSQDKNLGIAVSRWVQPIGTYSGMVLGADVGQLIGVIEDHTARW